MPQFLAIEWGARECRAAVAALRGRQVVIEHAFSFPRDPADDSPDTLGTQLAKELDARGCGRPETLVSVGRTRIELRQFTVPPATNDDLPDLVRFQATREFNELDDSWKLDFLPIDTAADGPKAILATAIAPAEITAIEKVCLRAGLTLRRVLLRPCETATLLDGGGAGSLPRMLIEIFAEECDLTVIQGGKTVFLRTTRFAGERPPLPALIAEIRLTMAAARNQLAVEQGDSVKIESLVLCGRDEADAELARSVTAELGLPVTLLDPYAGMTIAPSLAAAMPSHPARYAPLLGTLQAELRSAGHAIDFLNPRRRPPPVNRRKLWYALAGLAGALVVGYVIYARVSHIYLAADVADMQKQVKDLEQFIDKAKPVRQKAAEIRKWVDQETVWLDELEEMSRKMPTARDLLLEELSMNTAASRGSQIDLKGWTSKKDTLGQMAEAAGSMGNKMVPKSGQEENHAGYYTWRFEASVMIEKEPDKGPAASRPSGAAAKSSASLTSPGAPSGDSAAVRRPTAGGSATSGSRDSTNKPSAKTTATGATR